MIINTSSNYFVDFHGLNLTKKMQNNNFILKNCFSLQMTIR